MYKESLKFSLKCPKHKSFTPANGEGSIKGGCYSCTRVMDLFKRVREIDAAIKAYKEFHEREN